MNLHIILYKGHANLSVIIPVIVYRLLNQALEYHFISKNELFFRVHLLRFCLPENMHVRDVYM